MIYCGSVHPYVSGVSCERPGEGPQANHPEHTGWAGGDDLSPSMAYWTDWPNKEYVRPQPSSGRVGRRSKNPLKYQQTIQEISRKVRGGNDAKV
jgi:hypothetical protein